MCVSESWRMGLRMAMLFRLYAGDEEKAGKMTNELADMFDDRKLQKGDELVFFVDSQVLTRAHTPAHSIITQIPTCTSAVVYTHTRTHTHSLAHARMHHRVASSSRSTVMTIVPLLKTLSLARLSSPSIPTQTLQFPMYAPQYASKPILCFSLAHYL